ncbi:MAG: PocR ligand-binding domain-containing protein, partial [bacterium]|nr:PocR ligand-binding domain-containing protein [bacterium]
MLRPEKIELQELIDQKLLNKLLASFREATGLTARVLDADGKKLVEPEGYEDNCHFCRLLRSCPQGEERCLQSILKGGLQASKLGEPYIFFCHSGLVEWVAPIVAEDRYLGCVVCGQVLMWQPDDIFLNDIREKNDGLNIDHDELMGAARELKIVSGPKVQAAAELIFVIANHLAKTGLVTLMQRREISEQQSRLNDEIQARKTLEEELEQSKSVAISPLYPLEKERELLAKVRMGDRLGAKEILNNLLGDIFFKSAGHPEVIKARVLELVVVLSRAAVEGGASLERLLGLNFYYLQELYEIDSLDELSHWIARALDGFIDAVYDIRDLKNFRVIKQTVDYIEQNYNRDLSIDEIAKAVHLSPFYLSHLFKQQMDSTLVECLTGVRIEKAKQMLKETSRSITQVA